MSLSSTVRLSSCVRRSARRVAVRSWREQPAIGATAADTTRAGRRAPDRATTVTSASRASTWPADREPAGEPAATAARRSTRRRTAGGSSARTCDVEVAAPGPAASRSALLGPGVERVGVGAQQLGRTGQGGRDARAEGLLEGGQHLVAYRGRARRRGSALCGSSQTGRPSASAAAPGRLRGPASSSGRR